MSLLPLRRHPVVLGTVAAAIAALAAIGAAAAWSAADDDDPPRAPVDVMLRFDADDDEQPLLGRDVAGEPAPTDTFLTLDGRPTSLAAYRGKPLVLNFFGSWCVPCRKETPALKAVHADLGDEVSFLGLAIHDSQKSAEAFVDELGITWDIGRDTSDKLFIAFDVVSPPGTFVVSAEGRVVAEHRGEISEGELRKLLRTELGVS